MTTAYFDCFGGASGDMIVGSLLDAGLRLEALRAELKKLPFTGYALSCEKVSRAGLAGLKFNVEIEPHTHGQADDEHHHGRRLADILALLDAAKLAPRADRRARAVFHRLADAEARVHGCPVDEVHFHEVGAIDSIVDIVGAAIALELLDVETIVCSPIPLGSGTVCCAHGVLPVPAPATALLMRDGAIAPSDFAGELCTPTGAAILTTLAESFGPLPAMQLSSVGYGAGGRDDPGRANLLRVFVGSTGEDCTADTVVELAANIDDTSGQVIGAVMELLLEAGALDVWAAPIYMKKSRPAVQVGVLCGPADAERLERILFEQTTTIGIRRRECRRTKLQRRHVTVETPYGPIRVKVSSAGEVEYTAAAEFEDCLSAARSHHVPVREVQAAAQELYRRTRRE